MAIALLTPAFCTYEDLDAKFSEEGIDSFANHREASQVDDSINQAMNWARQEILNFGTQTSYEGGDTPLEQLIAHHPTINEWAVVLTVARICRKRGNGIPEELETELQEMRTAMVSWKDGDLLLQGLDPAYDASPQFSNLTMDRRYSRAIVRKVQNISSQAPSKMPTNLSSEPFTDFQ